MYTQFGEDIIWSQNLTFVTISEQLYHCLQDYRSQSKCRQLGILIPDKEAKKAVNEMLAQFDRRTLEMITAAREMQL